MSARRRLGRFRGPPATTSVTIGRPSPTPISCSAISTPPRWPAANYRSKNSCRCERLKSTSQSRSVSPSSQAAHGIRAVANAAMGRAIRAVTVERGRDPRDLTLIAMGGNGGIHAIDLARQLGIRRVIVPPMSGVFSAVGMLGADVEHTQLTTVLRPSPV